MSPTSKNKPQTRTQLTLVIAVAIFSWALAWVSIRAAVSHYSAGQLALGRYLVASLVLLPLFVIRRPQFAPRDWLLLFGAGVSGFTIYNLCINEGEKTITAGAAALIASTIPIFATFLAQLFLGEKTRVSTWIGGAIAICGVLLIALGEEKTKGASQGLLASLSISKGAILVLIASIGAAVYNVFQKLLLRRYASLDVTTTAIFCAVLTLIPFGGGLTTAVQTAPAYATWHLIILGIFPGALGYVLWSQALSQMPVAKLVVYLYLIAPLSILLGWLMLGELPSTLALWGGALALGGVIYSNKPQKAEK